MSTFFFACSPLSETFVIPFLLMLFVLTVRFTLGQIFAMRIRHTVATFKTKWKWKFENINENYGNKMFYFALLFRQMFRLKKKEIAKDGVNEAERIEKFMDILLIESEFRPLQSYVDYKIARNKNRQKRECEKRNRKTCDWTVWIRFGISRAWAKWTVFRLINFWPSRKEELHLTGARSIFFTKKSLTSHLHLVRFNCYVDCPFLSFVDLFPSNDINSCTRSKFKVNSSHLLSPFGHSNVNEF